MNDYIKNLDKEYEEIILNEKKKDLKQEIERFIDKLDKYDLKDFVYGVVKR